MPSRFISLAFCRMPLVPSTLFCKSAKSELSVLDVVRPSSEPARQKSDARDKLLGQCDYLLLVLGLAVLAPGYLNHAQDGKEVLGAADEHLLLERIVPQLGVAGQGHLQGSLVGHVHDDEVDGDAEACI